MRCDFHRKWVSRGLLLFLMFMLSMTARAADVSISIDAALPIRTIPETLYGGNLTAWDGAQNGSNSTFNNLLKASGRKYMRWCGGSWGNLHLWSDMEGPDRAYTWKVSYAETLNLLNILSQTGQTVSPTLQPIVNFPGVWYDVQHTHQEAVDAAVAWVQDQSSRTPTAQYWEIGNEIGGPWEAGYFDEISGTYYGDYFADFFLAMKAVNPNIKIGAVAEPYHGLQPWGWYQGYWTYDTLRAAYAKDAVPDFLIIHQYPGTDQLAAYNPTLLSTHVSDIAVFTSNMDSIVADALGPQYVGQIRYWMTEWDSGAHDNYNRRKCFVNALFHTQYILEMAKHNWEGSNAWAQWEYNSAYFVYPVWYVHPLLINFFGRHMVEASDSHSLVRSYAAQDADGNLTVLIVNNSPTADLTAEINIVGFQAAAGGLSWLVEPAGILVSGGVNVQDMDNISINGIVHPDPLTVASIAGQPMVASNQFSVSLPASRMLIVKIPLETAGGPDLTAPTPNPMGWLVRPYATGSSSIRMVAAAAADTSAVEYFFDCTFGAGHDSGWQTSRVYEDTGLTGGQTYTYTVKARDLSEHHNETLMSVPASAIPMSSAGGIDDDGYYVMGSQQLSGFNEAAAGTTALNFNGLKGTVSGIVGTSNSWWIAFSPTDRTKLPYSLTGAKGWKLPFKNTSAGALQLCLVVSTAANNWQQGSGCWLNPGQSGTAYVDITGPGTIYNFWIVVSVPRDYDVLTFTAEGVVETAVPWLYGDFDGSHQVDADDIPLFAALWLWNDCSFLTDFDLNEDCVIGLNEFAQIARNWLIVE